MFDISAREMLDSLGNPTGEVEPTLWLERTAQ